MPSLLVLAASQPFGLAALGIAVAVRGTGIPGDEVAWSALAAVAGVGWALLAMLAFGAYYVPMHAASTQDWLWPAFLFRCTSVTLVYSAVLIRRVRPTGLRGHWRGLIAIGLLDTGGNALFAAASSSHGLLSVESVLASLYPVVTVLLARLMLGERVQRTQDAGVLLVLVGVVLITAGG